MTRVRETARTRRLRRGACPEPFDLPTVRPDRSASLRAGFVEGLGSRPCAILSELSESTMWLLEVTLEPCKQSACAN